MTRPLFQSHISAIPNNLKSLTWTFRSVADIPRKYFKTNLVSSQPVNLFAVWAFNRFTQCYRKTINNLYEFSLCSTEIISIHGIDWFLKTGMIIEVICFRFIPHELDRMAKPIQKRTQAEKFLLLQSIVWIFGKI